MRASHLPPALLLLLLLLLAQRVDYADAAICNRTLPVDSQYLFRQYSISTESPTAAALRRRPELRERIDPLVTMTRSLFDTIDARIRVNDSRACNLAIIPWTREGFVQANARQLADLDNICNSRVDGNEAITSADFPARFVKSAPSVIRQAKDALFQATSAIPFLSDSSPNKPTNWTVDPAQLRDWDLRRLGQQCSVESSFAYRKQDRIYLASAITNRPVNAFIPDYNRHYIYEFIKQDYSSSLPLCHPKYEGIIQSNLTTVPNETSTTIITMTGGKASLATFGVMDLDENPAIAEAMRLNEIAIDQAQDAITPSNMAILALPMVMSLIPVAFVADLNTCATLWYIIFTDIFSTLPFLIKGIELVQSAEVRRSELVAYHIGNATFGALEVWAAECHGDDSFRILGIVFVTIAVMIIVGGVALELVANRYMRRRRQKVGYDAEGPFGMAAFDTTAHSLLGGGPIKREQDRRYSDESALYESRHRSHTRVAEVSIWLRRKIHAFCLDHPNPDHPPPPHTSTDARRMEAALRVPGVAADGLTSSERYENSLGGDLSHYPIDAKGAGAPKPS